MSDSPVILEAKALIQEIEESHRILQRESGKMIRHMVRLQEIVKDWESRKDAARAAGCTERREPVSEQKAAPGDLQSTLGRLCFGGHEVDQLIERISKLEAQLANKDKLLLEVIATKKRYDERIDLLEDENEKLKALEAQLAEAKEELAIYKPVAVVDIGGTI